MGFADRFRAALFGGASFADSDTLNPLGLFGGVKTEQLVSLDRLTVSQMWDSQPHLRTVVDFLARNVAHVGVHTFDRGPDDSRDRDRSSDAARLMTVPSPGVTGYSMLFALVADRALYDRAYLWLQVDTERTDGLGHSLIRLPPSWVSPKAADPFTRKHFMVSTPNSSQPVKIPAEEIVEFHGYNPDSLLSGSSPMGVLKAILEETLQSSQYRRQVWKNGGRISAVLTRPAGAPKWSDVAKERFRSDWYASYSGNGPKAGGTPILDDGMTMEKIDFAAKDQQYVEGVKLNFTTVCAVYHVNPTMVGILDNANYSNVREFRRMLYGDTLGPWFADLEATLNNVLLPMLGEDSGTKYFEFNVGEKLQGSFEEQAAVMQTLVGGPIMVRNEGRARFNLSAIEGGDELITPLNVIVGKLPSNAAPVPDDVTGAAEEEAPPPIPDDTTGAASRTLHVKAAPTDSQREKAAETVKEFFARQERVVRTAMGVKSAGDWFDDERWDRELSAALLVSAKKVAGEIGPATAKSLGFDESDYDAERTYAFLGAVSDRLAGLVNKTTKDALIAALADEEDVPAAVTSVWTVAGESRSKAVGIGLAATVAGFATVEAATQVDTADRSVTKTWETGANPRPSHASMNGETVDIDAEFSNGAQWPADISLSVDEVAGCNCSVSINVES